MLPRKHSLSLRKEYPRIRKSGRSYDCPLFSLIVADIPHKDGVSKCAFVISKKVDKKSVVRHEVKRKLAEAVHHYIFSLTHPVELVFLTKQEIVKADAQKIKEEVLQIFRRAHLMV